MNKAQWIVLTLLILLAVLVLYKNNKLVLSPFMKTFIQTVFSKNGLVPQKSG